MRKILLIVAAMVPFVLVLPANADPPQDPPPPPPSNVAVKATDAKCSKRVCSALVTTAGPPTELNPVCEFALDLFSKARLNPSVAPFVLGVLEGRAPSSKDVAELHAVRCGDSKRITMRVTRIGRFVINKALEAGRRKLKGKSDFAVLFNAPNPDQSFGEPASYFYGAAQGGSVRIKLKGKA